MDEYARWQPEPPRRSKPQGSVLNQQGSDSGREDNVSLIFECCDEFALAPGGWGGLLRLAEQNGWCPAGTEAPDYPWLEEDPSEDDGSGFYWQGDPSEWSECYSPGYGQRVNAKDAQALATALQKALPDLPDHDAFEQRAVEPDAQGISSEGPPRFKAPRRTSLFELYGGERKEVLREFIAHCRECRSGFYVWSYESR